MTSQIFSRPEPPWMLEEASDDEITEIERLKEKQRERERKPPEKQQDETQDSPSS